MTVRLPPALLGLLVSGVAAAAQAQSQHPTPRPVGASAGKAPVVATTSALPVTRNPTPPSATAATTPPAPPVAAASPAPGATGNSWGAGVIGVLMLCAGAAVGLRAAKNRGVTVEAALQRLGVETPDTAPAESFASLRPAPAPMPPLPSLSELPPAVPSPIAAPPMSATVARSRLVGIAGRVDGEAFPLDAVEALTIGRDALCGISLTGDAAVSRSHARIEMSPGGWQIVDSGSANGTFVNGARLTTPQRLVAGDEIQIGGTRFRFEG
jgi:hypothetical protein